MVAIRAVAHFSIPVSDTEKSTKFYTEVVGCKHLSTTPNRQMVFLDATGTCLILVKRDAPITIDRWAERFLSTLAEPRQRGKILGGLRQRFAARG